MLAACGGGSSSPEPEPIAIAPPPANEEPVEQEPVEETEPGFATGEFLAYQDYEQMCLEPREGRDTNGNLFPDIQGTTTDENNWLRSWSNELYLWYDEIADVDPASLSTPDYFDAMRTFETTPSGAPKDKFHFTIPTDEYIQQSQSGIQGGYGATFSILQSTPPRLVVVAYTEPDTPATAEDVNLRRGAILLEVDGEDLVNGNNTAVLNAGLFPGDNETHTFLIQDSETSEPREITMTSAQITSTPVQNVSTIETDTGLVGYLTFNDHIATAERGLFNAIEQLRDANVTDLVLDMRYNGGGFLAIANELGYMVAGDLAVGRVFEVMEFNDKHPIINPVTGATLNPRTFYTTARNFSVASGTRLPTLGLSRVFVLTGPGTCSASESVMNSLRGIGVDVIQIGSTTCGKPYGFYAFDNCGTSYFSIQFRGVNDAGFGDYPDGFSPENTAQTEGVPLPGCAVSDDFTRQLGDPLEGRLRAALQYRQDGTCPSILSAANARPRSRLAAVDGEVIKPAWLQSRIAVPELVTE